MARPKLGPISIIGAVIGKDKLLTKRFVVVVFRTGPKRYAYKNPGYDINVGDIIIVPTRSGNDLEAEVVELTNSQSAARKATREVIG